MKQVFQLSIQIEDLHADLYFEDQETAEYTYELLMKMATGKLKKKIKIEANIYQVYTKKMVSEQLMGIIGLTADDVQC